MDQPSPRLLGARSLRVFRPASLAKDRERGRTVGPGFSSSGDEVCSTEHYYCQLLRPQLLETSAATPRLARARMPPQKGRRRAGHAGQAHRPGLRYRLFGSGNPAAGLSTGAAPRARRSSGARCCHPALVSKDTGVAGFQSATLMPNNFSAFLK